MGTVISAGIATMNTVRSMFAGAALLALPAEAQEHRFEADPVVMVRENFVACDVLSQLQRVMDNPRFLLSGECDPVRAGDRVRVYARRGPYVCIYPHDTVSPCKWTRKRWPNKRAQQYIAKCVVCRETMDQRDSTAVPVYKLIHRPEDA